MSCLDNIKAQFPELKDAEARRLVTALEQLKELHKGNLGEYNKKAKLLVGEAKLSKLLELKARVNNVVKMKNNLEHIVQPGFENNPVEGMLSLIEGTNRQVKNSRRTVERLYGNTRKKYIDLFHTELKAMDFDAEFATGSFDKEIANEILGRTKPGHTPTKIKQVKQMADLIEKVNKGLINEQQIAGSTITYSPGYLIANAHNPELILQNPAKWVDDIIPRLDLEASLGTTDIKEARKALEQMSNNIEDMGLSNPRFMGGRQKLIFKTGADFVSYNETYGYHNLMSGVMRSIDVAAKKTALTEIFGNNPIQALDQLKTTIGDIQPGNQKLKNDLSKVQDAIDLFSGKGNFFMSPDSIGSTTYRGVQAFKTHQIFRLLGGTGFTSLNDFGSIMMTLRTSDGQGVVQSFVDTTLNFVTSSPFSGSKKELADLLSVSIDEITREVFESIGTADYNQGLGSKIMNKWMWANLTTPITNMAQSTAMKVHMKALSQNLLSDTPNSFQLQTREAIGLTPQDIKVLRGLKDEKGLITSRAVLDSDLDEKAKFKLHNKMASFFTEAVNQGSPRAGNKEFRLMKRHKPKDDPTRIAAEVALQFKGTLFKAQHTFSEFVRSNHPDSKMSFKNWNVVKSTGQFLFAAALVKIASEELRNFAEGKDSKPITGKRIVQASVSSGAAGLYADMLLEVYARDGQSRGISPIIGAVDDIQNYLANPSNSKKSAADKAWKILERQTPGQNLWLKKAVENYILKEGSYRSKRGKY